MENCSKFKIFRIGPYPVFGSIYVIATGSKSDNSNSIDAELFFHVTYNHKNAHEKYTSDDAYDQIETFWELIIELLRYTIYNNEYIPVVFEKSNFEVLNYQTVRYNKFVLQEIEKEEIINLNKEFLDYLKENTNCPALMEYLELQ